MFGIVIVGGLVILSWWLGWFSIIFYILGLYASVYIVSYVFKTTSIINFLIGSGVVVLNIISLIVGLYFMYIALQIMFTESFWRGFLYLGLFGLFARFLALIPVAVGLVLGYPLFFMSEDIEKRISAID